MQHHFFWPALVVLTLGGSLTAAEPAGETIRFEHRPPQVGDQSSQEVRFEMNLAVTLTQSEQTIHTTHRSLERNQRRRITALTVSGGRVTRARVQYAVSEESAAEGGGPATHRTHPVEGRTYLVAREADDSLRITDPAGGRPSPEEIAIIEQTMEALGRRNPLALHFDGLTVKTGETVSLPRHLAGELLGLGESVGEVRRFDMMLTGTHDLDGHRCAVFDTSIDADSLLSSGQTLAMRGQFQMEIDTCRVMAVHVSCPLDVVETRGPMGGRFSVHGKGTLLVSMQARHVHAVSSTSR